MAATDLNEPCPCGSGKKYKDCCFAKERQADSGEQEGQSAYVGRIQAVMEAFAWLLRDEARRNAIFEGFYGIDRDLARRVGEAKDELDRKMHFGVLAEWALAECPRADAARAGFARLVLRECPASFSREDLAWIRALEGSTVSGVEDIISPYGISVFSSVI